MSIRIAVAVCGLLAVGGGAGLRGQQATASVLGDVENARVAVTAESTLLDAFFAAKARRAALEHVVLLRFGGEELLALDIDLLTMLKTGVTTGNVLVKAGDVLVIQNKQGWQGARTETAIIDLALDLAMRTELPSSSRAQLLGWRLRNGSDVRRRQEVAMELGQLGAEAAPALQSLIAALAGELAVAREAATAIGMIGAGARSAIPALEKLATHADVQLRERARASLVQIRKALATKG
ncbi:MAG: HEAT repeat domain-containing protein [Planctomycetota bacterium]